MSNKPDYEKIQTVDEVEAEIQKHKDTLCRKVKERAQVKEAKKEAVGAYNEQLKECEESLNFHTEVIDELQRHKRLLVAGKPGLRSVS